MATFDFKDLIDLPCWRPLAVSPVTSGNGMSMAWDMRNSPRNVPWNYLLASNTSLSAYSPQNDEWIGLPSPALAGVFGAGAGAVLHPSQGPRGVLAAGNTTTSVVISTVLPGSIGGNQLANRGDGVGHTIRIIGSSAGGSGKTEERVIVANTSGTTPTITLDAPLTFTPAVGDSYEIRSGRVYMLGAGTIAAGIWKFYDIATNTISTNLATANLPATLAVDSTFVVLSEGHVPSDAADSSSGFLGVLTAGAGATSTTLTTGSGLAATPLFGNEYRNFQIRIVEDTVNPTAVGQRRRIASHTAGSTPVWTISVAWTVTPSSSAKFVIENDDDKILLFQAAQTSVYTYNIAANTWDTSTFATPAAGGAGSVAAQSFGIVRDITGQARHSHIYRIRGGNVATADILDIAGNTNGAWANGITYGGLGGTSFSTGTAGAYDPITHGGKYLYININSTTRYARFDMRNRVLEPWTNLLFPTGISIAGSRLSFAYYFDGSTKLGFLQTQLPTSNLSFSIACQR